MDVRAKNRDRSHQEVGFPAAAVMGRNFLTPLHQSIRVKNVCWKFRPKVYVYVEFSLNKRCFLNGVFQSGVLRGQSGIHKGRRHQNARNDWCFQAGVVPLKEFTSQTAASRDTKKNSTRLENNVWIMRPQGRKAYEPQKV